MPRGYRFLISGKSEPDTLPHIQAATGTAALRLFIDRPPLSDGLADTLSEIAQRLPGEQPA